MKFFQNIKTGLAFIAATSLFAVSTTLLAAPASAQFKNELCGGASLKLTAEQCKDKGEEAEKGINRLISTIINVLSVIIGVIAVIFIIIGGAKYITSGGDAGKVSSAKNTVIYAIVGLIIVALAQFIVRFVLSRL
jgi:hypothetical protein